MNLTGLECNGKSPYRPCGVTFLTRRSALLWSKRDRYRDCQSEKKSKVEIVLPSEWIDFISAFSSGQLLSPRLLQVFIAFHLKWKGEFEVPGLHSVRGQRVWKYSSQHRLCSRDGLAFLQFPSTYPQGQSEICLQAWWPLVVLLGQWDRGRSLVLHRYEMSMSLKNKIPVVLGAGQAALSSSSRMWQWPRGPCWAQRPSSGWSLMPAVSWFYFFFVCRLFLQRKRQ